jgi:two-component system KDP operon response regulator KdpE
LRVYIGSLRRKLEIDPSRPQHILTELGVGYRLVIDTGAEPGG